MQDEDNQTIVAAKTPEEMAEAVVTPEEKAEATEAELDGPIKDATESNKEQKIIANTENEEAIKEVADKIQASENILVALSDSPSVDDIAAAIALTMALDKMGKHATAIYSGVTPNVLEFLEPGKTLEPNADSLQDLVIALNKDKADHLKYKVDGEFVKIFITPYRTKLSQEDLSYSYGDYNVDLVIALNVPAATNLDNVLREHGRIMHDASAIDITVGAPGRFGEIEWSDPSKSSVSEMITGLLFGMNMEVDSTITTALLAGIVGATERFKNDKTNPDTMKVAAKLMENGADAQLVAENVESEEEATTPQLEVPETLEEVTPEEPEPAEIEVPREVDTPVLNDDLMEELRRQQEEANKPQEEGPEEKGPEVPDYGKMIDEALAEVNGAVPAEPIPEAPASPVMTEIATETGGATEAGGVNLQPSAEFVAENSALVENAEPAAPTIPEMPTVAVETSPEQVGNLVTQPEPAIEPAMPMPGDEVLPPPPTPEVSFEPSMPTEAPATDALAVGDVPTIGETPMANNPEVPGVEAGADPSAFKIPGM